MTNISFSPLTKTQYGIYIECMEHPESTTYNIPFLQRLSDDTDLERMRQAVRRLVDAHPALQCKVVTDAQGQAGFQKAAPPELEVIRLSNQEWELQKEDLVHPFSFEQDVLSRFRVYVTPDAMYYFQELHHLIGDGTSMNILSRNLGLAYEGKEIVPEKESIFDVAEKELAARNSKEWEEQKAFYQKLLEGAEPDSAPMPDAEEKKPSQGWLTVKFHLDEDRLQALKHDGITSPGNFFTSVMGYVTARYNYTKTSVINTIYHGRDDVETADTVGMFVKTIPFVTDFSEIDNVSQFLQTNANNLKESRKRTLYSFADIASDLGALDEIMFVYQAQLLDVALATWSGYETTWIFDPAHIENTKMSLELRRLGGGEYFIHFGYRKDVYSEEFAQGYVNAYINAVRSFLQSEKLSQVLLTSEDDIALLDRFNETELAYDQTSTVVDLFRKVVTRFPERDAVIIRDKHITYRELDEQTDALAARLRLLGIGRDKVVGILIPRDENIVVCSLGVLKAGGAYLPLDPTYPAERLNLMMEDSGASVLIADPALAPLITGEFTGERIMTNELSELPEESAYRNTGEIETREDKCFVNDTSAVKSGPDPQDLFVLLYTSGTTGKPKGVMYMHSNMMALCAVIRNLYDLDEECVVSQYASYGFDACTMDLYPALTSGSAICIVPEDMRLDLDAVTDYFRENKVTHSFMTTQMARQFASLGNPGTLRAMMTGGEKLASMDPPEYDFYNAYGPSEFTVITTYFRLDKRYEDIPIGKPTANTKLYVVDTDGNRLPPGAAGELWASGPQLTKGYLNRPDKTKEAYRNNPFAQDELYSGIFRTGDVVRYQQDGTLQFVGRRDAQVKIRGFRIELTEVEEVIRRFPGIRDAVCTAYDNPSGGKFLAAYIVALQDVDIHALEQFILKEKPPYMVPAVTMQIDAIPYTPNHKVDKRALPYPQRKAEKYISPETDLQQQIFDLLADILGHKEFGIDTDIYTAGLTSIGTVQFSIALSKHFGVHMNMQTLEEHSTIRKLEGLLEAEQCKDIDNSTDKDFYPEGLPKAEQSRDIAITENKDSHSDNTTDQTSSGKTDGLPPVLSKTQLGILAECMAHPGSTIYNIPLALALDGYIDMNKLADALCKAIANHPYLLAHLETDPNGEVRPEMVRGGQTDYEALARERIEMITDRDFADERDLLVQPFTLVGGDLFRIKLFDRPDKYLFMDIHHILCDGTSLNILLEDLSAAYLGEPMEKEEFSGYEAAWEEQRRSNGKEMEEARQFYQNLLDGADFSCLPPATVHQKEVGNAILTVPYSGKASEITAFCTRSNLSMATLFHAAFGYVLGKYIYRDDVTFCSVYHGRSDVRMLRTTSMLVKTFPVRCTQDEGETVLEYLQEVARRMRGAMAHDIYSFADISKDYGLDADILFVFQGDMFPMDSLCGLPCRLVDMELDSVKAPINVEVNREDEELLLKASYRADLYDDAFMKGFLGSVLRCVQEFTEKDRLCDVDLLDESIRNQLTAFNETDWPVPEESVNRMFERWAADEPQKTAAITPNGTLTYKELNRLSNRAAHALLKRGVQKDEIIGLLVPRSQEVLIGELGILKAGGAFLPMVPEFPDERIDYCLTDAQSRYVLTTQALKESRPELFTGKPYEAITFEELLKEECEDNPDLAILTDSLAYCIYTSGTTGKPKGVMIEHHNLRHFLEPCPKNLEVYHYKTLGTTILAVISISFDFSILELLGCVCNGLCVCMASEEEIHNPAKLAEKAMQAGVDVFDGTPSMIGNMMEFPQMQKAMEHAAFYVIGAESFPESLYGRIHEVSPHAVILNGYGPTETTISCNAKVLTGADSITIGYPFANVKTWCLDRQQRLLPPYACGELVIAGELVGRGYKNLPEKTAAAFVQFQGLPAFRTGDVVRILEDGQIEFFGRLDNQVKLRGFRVELDEIERCMGSYEGIRISKVVVRNNGTEDYLCGYFTADHAIDLHDLTAFMRERLAYYMVPDMMMQLDAMPLTANGKIDKNALPEIRREKRQSGRKAPKKSLEEQIVELFAQVLGAEEVYADDNFFEIGGTSLSATKVVMQLLSRGYQVEYQDIFDHPTPEELAQLLESRIAGNAAKTGGNASETGEADAPEQPGITDRASVPSRNGSCGLVTDPKYQNVLSHNTLEYASKTRRTPLGDVLLTGAVGFLGIHVLKELLDAGEGTICCLIRSSETSAPQNRLRTMLMYYFGRAFAQELSERITVIDADITDENLVQKLEGIHFDTLINCAAVVKHYASDDMIEHINVGGVENLIRCAQAHGARMIQISTTSVPGAHTATTYQARVRMYENELFLVDSMDNKYVLSKYRAEQKMLEAIEGGLNGKIIRVGNLMGRHSDGEFQINFNTNAFLQALKGFAAIGKCPISHATDPMSFSPIDLTARAIVALAGTNREFTAFHADNRITFDEMQLIEACNRQGVPIHPVSDEEYYADYYRMLGDEAKNTVLSGLLTNDRPGLHMVETDNTFTANVLYRVGFSWPLVDSSYLERAIKFLVTMDYFDVTD